MILMSTKSPRYEITYGTAARVHADIAKEHLAEALELEIKSCLENTQHYMGLELRDHAQKLLDGNKSEWRLVEGKTQHWTISTVDGVLTPESRAICTRLLSPNVD